jgi:hypothetical protein
VKFTRGVKDFCVGFEVLTAATVKSMVISDVAASSSVEVQRRLLAYCLFLALSMEAIHTTVDCNRTTRCYMPEDRVVFLKKYFVRRILFLRFGKPHVDLIMYN